LLDFETFSQTGRANLFLNGSSSQLLIDAQTLDLGASPSCGFRAAYQIVKEN